MKKKILVIGNGATGIDENGKSFVNEHTGKFLKNINSQKYQASFLQFGGDHDIHTNLRGYKLEENKIKSYVLSSSKLLFLFTLLKLLTIIVKHDFVYIFIPGLLGKIVGCCCLILNKDFGLYIRGELFEQSKIYKSLIVKASFVLTVSPLLRDKISKFNSNVSVIRPMTELSLAHQYRRPPLENAPEVWELLFVGRVEDRKGINELIDVSKRLHQFGIKHKLRIVGGGSLTNQLERDNKDGNLPDSIILEGHVDDYNKILKFYEESDLFVFLSHDEGFPRTLYEAMIKSLPIFTTFVGGIPGRMKDGYNCFEVPVKNPEKAAEIIRSKIQDIEILNRVGQNGFDTTLNVLSSEKPHEKLLIQNL